MSLPSRLLGANPSIQVSTLLSGTLTTPSAKSSFAFPTDFDSIASSAGGSTSVTFDSIPQTYKHLQLRMTTFSGQSFIPSLRFNGETGSYYYLSKVEATRESGTNFVRNVSSSVSSSIVLGNSIGLDATYPTSGIFNILDYTNSSSKPNVTGVMGQNSDATSYNYAGVLGGFFNFSSGAAVTSITIFLGGNTFTTGTNIALYGIKG